MTTITIKKLEKDIANYKDKLMKKAKKSGITENFGRDYVMTIRDKYPTLGMDDPILRQTIDAIINRFDDWCTNFNLDYIK